MLSTSMRPDKVELILLQESILPDSAKEKLVSVFGDECLKWERNKLLAMSIACTEGEIPNESLQFVLHSHRTDITALLRNLKEEGLLESNGYGRGTRYHIPSSMVGKSQNLPSSGQNLPSSGQNLPSSGQSMTSSKHIKKEISYEMVLEYCSIYRSAEAIAKHLGKNVKYVKTEIICKLEKQGLITRQFPNKSRHPYQKYIAVQKN